MAQEPQSRHTALLTWIPVVVLMIWIVIMVTCAQLRMSATFDEQNHVTRGIAILHTGDFGYCFHHPPLANILEALPVAWQPNGFTTDSAAWRDRKDPMQVWSASNATIWGNNPAAGVRLIEWARVPVLIFTLVLALVVFLWSRELFGPWGGLFSLTLFALDPNILAHSGLATTDMAAACTIVLAIYLLRKYIFGPSRARLIFAGAGVGLALAAKFSSLILLPILALLLLGFVLRTPKLEGSLPARWAGLATGKRFGRAVVQGLLILVVGLVVLWACYGFKVEAFGSKPGVPVAANASLIHHFPIPAFQYLRGVKAVKTEQKGKPAYLFGAVDRSGKGWWYYFPVTIVTKTPIPELILLLGMVVLLAVPRTRAQLGVPRRELLFLLLPIVIYMLAAMGALGIRWNMGIRHLLPIYPLLFILAGGWVMLRLPRRLYVPALGIVLALQCASVLVAYPDYIAYFNALSGGHGNGSPIFVDSNLDWGQDLEQLAALQRDQHLYPLAFSYFGSTPPEAYGIQCTPVTGFKLMERAPAPDLRQFHGYLAISVTELMAGDGYCKKPELRPFEETLQHMTPCVRAGDTILVYRFP